MSSTFKSEIKNDVVVIEVETLNMIFKRCVSWSGNLLPFYLFKSATTNI